MDTNSGRRTREVDSSNSTFSTPPSNPPSTPIANRVGFFEGGASSSVGVGEGGYECMGERMLRNNFHFQFACFILVPGIKQIAGCKLEPI